MPSKSPAWRDRYLDPLVCYLATSTIVVLGVFFGHDFLPLDSHYATEGSETLLAFLNWDGRHYLQIVEDGYSHLPGGTSEVAFFPAYPLLGKGVQLLTGLRPEWCLLIVAHAALIATFLVTSAYLRCRDVRTGESLPAEYVLLAFGVFPSTFFFRMGYTESLFVLLIILALMGMHRRWQAWATALIIGLATATRPVGVSLLLPFAWHLYKSSQSRAHAAWQWCSLLPLACWGLFAYMGYQYVAFEDPLAFAKTQEFYRTRPAADMAEKLVALGTLRPFWELYIPGSPTFWQDGGRHPNAFFGLQYWNPVYFLGTCVLIFIGARKGWLTDYEVLVSIPLLGIPYVTRAFEMGMSSHARFAAAVFPAFIVGGHLLSRMPAVPLALLTALFACLLIFNSALFAAWYFML